MAKIRDLEQKGHEVRFYLDDGTKRDIAFPWDWEIYNKHDAILALLIDGKTYSFRRGDDEQVINPVGREWVQV